MRSLALGVATAAVLTVAFPQGPVLAQGHDDGAVGRTLQLDGGPSPGSDSRGQSSGGRSEGTEQPAGVTSEKRQTGIGTTGETTSRAHSQTHIGLRHRLRHSLALHKRGHHVFVFHVPRHGFLIHRHGRRFVTFSEPASA
jgi:hypothetical protein